MCIHHKQKYQCLVCLTVEEVLRKDWVCKICVITRTKAAICRGCFDAMSDSPGMSLEAMTYSGINFSISKPFFKGYWHFLWCWSKVKQDLFGGVACKTKVDGDFCLN